MRNEERKRKQKPTILLHTKKNSNHIEGSRLTHDQTRYIFETNTIGIQDDVLNIDDILETANHFKCIDQIMDDVRT